MKIFFTGSIRGWREQQPNYSAIIDTLSWYGEVVSAHIALPNISEYGETALSARDISEREKERLQESDIVVAEITTTSLGVGYLIAYASSLNKKILALYEGENTLKLSAMIKGDPNVVVETYTNISQIEDILKKHFMS